MKYGEYDTDDLICALATPWGESALAVIRASGDGCIDAFSPVFRGRRNLDGVSGYSMRYGKIINPDTGQLADEVVSAFYRKPSSYTGQDMVEIMCHGSMAAVSAVLEALRAAGFRDARGGEFTLRAFLNGKMDLTRAEAINDIVKSKSSRAMQLALDRLSGAVYGRIDSIKQAVAAVLAGIELQLDYAEDEADPVATVDEGNIRSSIKAVEELSATYRIGKVIQEGVAAVLAGRTNAGKSSLFNLFNRMDRSIVSEHHGTTRDYIESFITIGGIPVKLFDTAGLRSADNPVEAEGIKKSSRIIGAADIVVYLVDSTEGETAEDGKFFSATAPEKLIRVWSKSDIGGKKPPAGYVAVSSVTGAGLDILEREITARINPGGADLTCGAVIDSERQKKLLDSALVSLRNALNSYDSNMPLDIIAVDIREALDFLGEITGEITSSDILEIMFSKFCVGK